MTDMFFKWKIIFNIIISNRQYFTSSHSSFNCKFNDVVHVVVLRSCRVFVTRFLAVMYCVIYVEIGSYLNLLSGAEVETAALQKETKVCPDRPVVDTKSCCSIKSSLICPST